MIEALKSTDYTLLMRSPTQRYAKAGFPTKVVESLSCATPVICNITSDLDKYLQDKVNSFIVPNCTSEALSVVLTEAIQTCFDDRREMQSEAYKTAVEQFSYEKFLSALEYIIKA